MDTIVPEPDTAIWWQRRDLKTVAVFKKPNIELLKRTLDIKNSSWWHLVREFIDALLTLVPQ